jgi:hypothetical protein
MVQYALEPFHQIASDVALKIPAHYAEKKSFGLPNLDWDYYLTASHMGLCKAITVRDDDKLVGYSVFFISHDTDRKHIQIATNAGVFLDPEYRGKIAIQLLKKSDEYLKELGAQEINYLLDDDRLGRLLGRNGYKSEYKLWSVKL